jgi:hypothetical protein
VHVSEPMNLGPAVVAVADGSRAEDASGLERDVPPVRRGRSVGRWIAIAVGISVLTITAIGGVFLLAAAASATSGAGGCGGG